jgi:hypothetical protein
LADISNFYPNIQQPMLKLKTHSGFHDLFLDFALNASVNWKLLLFSPMSMFEGNIPFPLVNVLTFRRKRKYKLLSSNQSILPYLYS